MAIGLTVAGVALGVLVVLVIIISVFSRKKYEHSSHFLDEERHSQRKSFSLGTREQSGDLHRDFRGNYIYMFYPLIH